MKLEELSTKKLQSLLKDRGLSSSYRLKKELIERLRKAFMSEIEETLSNTGSVDNGEDENEKQINQIEIDLTNNGIDFSPNLN